MELQQDKISIQFELRTKSVSETDPCPVVVSTICSIVRVTKARRLYRFTTELEWIEQNGRHHFENTIFRNLFFNILSTIFIAMILKCGPVRTNCQKIFTYSDDHLALNGRQTTD